MMDNDDLDFNLKRPTEVSFNQATSGAIDGVVFPFTMPVLNSAQNGYYEVTVLNILGDGRCDPKCRGFTYYQRCRHLTLVRQCLDKWIKQTRRQAVP